MSEYVCELPIDGMVSFESGTETIFVHERVVRCEECERCHILPGIVGPTGRPHQCWLYQDLKRFVEPDDFCAWAMPKDC